VNNGTLGIEGASTIAENGTGRSITYNAGAGVTTTAWFYNLTGTVTRPMFFNSSGGGTIVIGNASPQASTVGANMTLNGPVTITNLIGGLGSLTLNGNLLEGGTASSVTKTGPTLLVLGGNNTYAGETRIDGGTLQIGAGGTSGSLGVGSVTNNANLVFHRSDTVTVANAIAGTGQFHQNGTGTTVLSGVNSYRGATNVNAGNLVIGNGDALGGGSSSLNIGSLGTAHVGASLAKAVKVSGLSNAGTLDMANGKLVVDYSGATPFDAMQSQIVSGYAGGAWNGPGINSAAAAAGFNGHTTALGYVEASQAGFGGGTFGGQSVDADAVLVRYTFSGDANVDGKVDLTDFTFLAANFNKATGATWLNGDFNYDGKVDLTDFTFLASNFNSAMPADPVAAAPRLGSAVPEPATLGAAAPFATGLLTRRSRRRR
jgi:fibronectin-binding autotransporter adhesin